MKTLWLTGACAAAICCSPASMARAGQPASPDSTTLNAATARPAPASVAPATNTGTANQLQEVVVTARRRSENLQSVPIAVTALSGAELKNQNVIDISNVARTAPNVNITVGSQNPVAPTIAIRGQVQVDTLATEDPSVGVYVDGIYWSRIVGANAALVDVQSAEILKGPQGTLFGRNTTGGAVNIRTGDPVLTSYSGSASVTAGSYGEVDSTLVVNAPIVDDKLGVRFAYSHTGEDGYGVAYGTGQRLGAADTDTFRIKVLARPTDKSSVLLSYENFSFQGTPAAQKITYVDPAGAAGLDVLFASGGCVQAVLPSCPAPYVPGKDSLNNYANDPKVHSDSSTERLGTNTHTQTLGLTGTYDLGIGTLKAIGGYRKVNNFSVGDFSGTPYLLVDTDFQSVIEEYTGELQFNGRAFNDRFNYTVGYYWFKEAGNDDETADALAAINPVNPDYYLGIVDNRSQAAYGQGTYRLTDRLSLTGGVRYSIDHKALVSGNGVTEPGLGFVCAAPDGAGLPQSQCSQEFGTSSSDVDYTASLDYKFAPDILGYIKTAKGYRAGGINLRGLFTPAAFVAFQPETATNYEAGLKSELFERRVRLNLAAYYTDYSDIQRTANVSNGAGGVTSALVNAASGKVYGGEAELQWLVGHGLHLGASLGVTEASYDTYMDLLGDHSKEPFPYTPKVQASVSADYTHDVPHGHALLHADYAWQDTTYFLAGFLNGNTPDSPLSSIRQAPYGVVNLRLAYTLDPYNVEIAVFGRNVGNTQYRTAVEDFVGAGIGYNVAQYAPPATFGVQVSYKFGG